jgi:hypothetical protein
MVLCWAVAVPAATTVTAGVVNVQQACRDLVQHVSGLAFDDCMATAVHFSANWRSTQGRPLLERDYPTQRPKPHRVLLIGAVHGDEPAAVALVFRWMALLARSPDQPFTWRVLPCANPDGVEDPKGRHRTNAHGVDLNRNFASPDWNQRAVKYWHSRAGADPRRFPGPRAASEVETRWITDEIYRFKPDAIISVHAPYGLLDYDGPEDPPQRVGSLLLHPLGTFPGSLGNYAGHYLRLPVITLELPQAAHPPTVSQSTRMWTDLMQYLGAHLPRQRPGMALLPIPAGHR